MTTAPTDELGRAARTPASLPGWGEFHGSSDEHAAAVRWPKSIETYTRMRTDAQIRGLTSGVSLPIRRMRWEIDPGEARPEVAAQVAQDFNLPVRGEAPAPRGRRRDRFDHDLFLSRALTALWYGWYPFEIIGRIDDGGRWRLRKLAPRHPKTIVGGKIKVARDGGLESIKQAGLTAPPMPIERLVVFTWENEDGANWTGQSMLRACYRNWLAKDRTLRTGTLNIERNGMGIPSVEAPEGAGQEDIDTINAAAAEIKSGERSAVTWPHGAKFKLAGVEGSLPDSAGWIRLQNEEMARAFLEMFAQLGTTETGSRALGAELIDFFDNALEAIADWYADIVSAYVIEKWVDWNYGPDEAAPSLTYQRPDTVGVADIAEAVNSGLIQVDEEIEAALRRQLRLPERDDSNPPPTPPPSEDGDDGEGVSASTRRGHVERSTWRPPAARHDHTVDRSFGVGAAAQHSQLAARTQLNEVEAQAGIDFEAMEARLLTRIEALVEALTAAQAEQVEALVEQIVEIGPDVERLAALDLDASPDVVQALAEAMTAQAEDGAADAQAEAEAQGVSSPAEPDSARIEEYVAGQSAARGVLLARALAGVASRQAVLRASQGLGGEAIASGVRDYIGGLSNAWLEEQANAALIGGQNAGRLETMEANEATRYYASELMDENTCSSCAAIDGTEYDTLDDAREDYPSAGYKDCEGRERCRGTLVAVYDEAEPSVQ